MSLPDNPKDRKQTLLMIWAGADLVAPSKPARDREEGYLFYLSGVDTESALPALPTRDRRETYYAYKCGQVKKLPALPARDSTEEYWEVICGRSTNIPTAPRDSTQQIIDVIATQNRIVNILSVTKDNVVIGKYIDAAGAEKSNSSNFYCSDYFSVTAGGTYNVKITDTLSYFNVMEYDAEKEFIKRTQKTNTNQFEITLQSTTAFVRIGSNMYAVDITVDDVVGVDYYMNLLSAPEPEVEPNT